MKNERVLTARLSEVDQTAKVSGYYFALRDKATKMVGADLAYSLGFVGRAHRAAAVNRQAIESLRGKGLKAEILGTINKFRGSVAGRRRCRFPTFVEEVTSSVARKTARR